MAPKTPPGQTRRQVFAFVRQQLLAGRPPTVRDVQHAFGFRSVQTAREHLEMLVAEGQLTKEPGTSRGYRLPERSTAAPAVFVPLLGRVQAGPLTEAIEDPDGYLAVQGHEAGEGLFALRVRGESMSGAGILPGDLVVVRRQATAQSGDIVVALVDGEATVKRLRLRQGRAELHPQNPAFAPIIPKAGALELLGKVIEVRRYLEEGSKVHD